MDQGLCRHIASLGSKGLTLTFVISAMYLSCLFGIAGTCVKLSVFIIWMFRIVRKLQIKFFEDRILIRKATEASFFSMFEQIDSLLKYVMSAGHFTH